MMKALWTYRPDLWACELEDRLVAAVPVPGAIVPTAGGYVLLLSPFPITEADPFGASGGPGFLTPAAMTGGVASLLPANSAGAPGFASTPPAGSSAGPAVTITVGSGAEDASAPVIPPVTRNTVANDALNAAVSIGRVSSDQSAALPPEQVYRGGVPVAAPGGVRAEAPGGPAASDPGERPVDPLKIRLRNPQHPLASDASGNLVKSNADRVP
jgi:hypothetical protein